MIGEKEDAAKTRLDSAKLIADFIPKASARYSFFREGIKLDGAFEQGLTMDKILKGGCRIRTDAASPPFCFFICLSLYLLLMKYISLNRSYTIIAFPDTIIANALSRKCHMFVAFFVALLCDIYVTKPMI